MKLYNALNKTANSSYIFLPKIAIVLIFVFANACTKTKDLPACTGNCTDVIFSGKVSDLSANAPLSHVVMKIYLDPPSAGYLIPHDDYIAASGTTGSDGSFMFHPQYNTAKYKNYYVLIDATIPNGYIRYPQEIVPTEHSAGDDIYGFQLSATDYSHFTNVAFTLMQKTLLQIHMHRTTPIINDPSLTLELNTGAAGSGGGFTQSEANKDTTVSAYAGANVFYRNYSNQSCICNGLFCYKRFGEVH